MKRLQLEGANASPHFIGSWLLEPDSLCDELIAFFEAQGDRQSQGKTAGGLNPRAKNSMDLSVRPRDLERQDHDPVRRYIDALFECHLDYLAQWPFLKQVIPRVELGTFNIQRYEAGGHFLKPHSERTTVATAHRILAWMTYLNDVTDGGSTHFIHQELDVQPQKAKTLIWPAEWTHAHLGNLVNSGRKYIITGWMHFIAPDTDQAAPSADASGADAGPANG